VAAWVAGPGEEAAAPCAQKRKSRKHHMSVFDLIKATAVCGLTAFLVYSFPLIGQIAIIGLLGLLWLSCAHQVIQSVRRKWFA